MTKDTAIPTNIYEERAEHLSQRELTDWTVLSNAEKHIIQKLTGAGAKLISGPRGSGKSTLLRIAYFTLIESRTALPVYVNYSKALALEPLFHSRSDALQLFRQWVLAKILLSLRETLGLLSVEIDPELKTEIDKADRYIKALESGVTPDSVSEMSPSGVASQLQEIAKAQSIARTVLLLDDAAHAFSVKQQREFFEVFREFRSREISSKAAIYPGVTSFSPSFQVGHEAEVIQAWFRPDSPSYLSTMREIATKRFPEFVKMLGANANENIDVLALASFGLPRGFVGLISDVSDELQNSSRIRRVILDAIDAHADVVRTVFSNVADRLPRFKNYIDVGREFESSGRTALRAFNLRKSLRAKTATIALADPLPDEFVRVLRFMEYAGLIRRVEDLSKGVKGNYRRYLVHYASVIAGNALAIGKNYKLSNITDALQRPNAHSLVKTKPQTLLGNNVVARCTLALPPCPKCETLRVSEDQKFCMHCGNELRAASIYQELLKSPVDKLPLPSRKIQALQEAGIHQIQQILSDETQRFRRRGSSIGPVWTKRILTVAEEYVSV